MRLKSLESRSSLLHLAFGALLAAGAGFSGCLGEEATGPGSNALITLTSPQGGETFKVGDTVWIKWKTKEDDPDPVVAVDPIYSPDSGKTWKELSQSIGPDYKAWGNYGWKIPDSLFIGATWHKLAGNTKGLIGVQDYVNPKDPNRRSITRKTITISAP